MVVCACGASTGPAMGTREGMERMQQAVRVLLQGLGEDVNREGLRDTPKVSDCWQRRAGGLDWPQACSKRMCV